MDLFLYDNGLRHERVKIFNLYTLRILFDWNNCFVCSNMFPLLEIMRIAFFCWLDNFLSMSYVLLQATLA